MRIYIVILLICVVCPLPYFLLHTYGDQIKMPFWLFINIVIFITLCVSYIIYLKHKNSNLWKILDQYFGAECTKLLINQKSKLMLGTKTTTISVMFVDLQGFTKISEKLQDTPEILTYIMQRFFTIMSQQIQTERGIIDKYIGDCIMALWNTPHKLKNHTTHACRTALKLNMALKLLNQELLNHKYIYSICPNGLKLGIGINTGQCLVGHIGAEKRFNYSAIGNTVNVASHLESQTKFWGLSILVGEECYKNTQKFAYIEIDNLFNFEQKKTPERIYTLLGNEIYARTPEFQDIIQRHNKMRNAYHTEDWCIAKSLLLRLENDLPELKQCYQIYRDTINELEINPRSRKLFPEQAS